MKSCKLESIQSNETQKRGLSRLHGLAIVSAMILLLSSGRALAADYKLWRTAQAGKKSELVASASEDEKKKFSSALLKADVKFNKFIESEKLYSEPVKLVEAFRAALVKAYASPEQLPALQNALKKAAENKNLFKGSKEVKPALATQIQAILKQLAGMTKEQLESEEFLKSIFGDEDFGAIRQAAFKVTDTDPSKGKEPSEEEAKKLKETEEARKKAEDEAKKLKEELEKAKKDGAPTPPVKPSEEKPPVETPPVTSPPPKVGEQAQDFSAAVQPICDALAKVKEAQDKNAIQNQQNLDGLNETFNRLAQLANVPPVQNNRKNDDENIDQQIADAVRNLQQPQNQQQQFPQQQPTPADSGSANDLARNAVPPPTEATPPQQEPFQGPQQAPPQQGNFGPLAQVKPDVDQINPGTAERTAARNALDQADLSMLKEVPQIINPLTGMLTGNPLTIARTLGRMKQPLQDAMAKLVSTKKQVQNRIDKLTSDINTAKGNVLGEDTEATLANYQEVARTAKREADNMDPQDPRAAQARSRAAEAQQRVEDFQSRMNTAKKPANAVIKAREAELAKLQNDLSEIETKTASIKTRAEEVQDALDQNTQATTNYMMQGQQSARPNAFGATGAASAAGAPAVPTRASQAQTGATGNLGRGRLGR